MGRRGLVGRGEPQVEAPSGRGFGEPGALGVCNGGLGFWGAGWGQMAVRGGGVPAGGMGMQMLMSHSPRRPVCIYRPQKSRGMDEGGVRPPAEPPTRKKFLIPLDGDAAPPAGVGQRDGAGGEGVGGRWEAGRVVEGEGRGGGRGGSGATGGLGNAGRWVTLGNQPFAFPLSFSVCKTSRWLRGRAKAEAASWQQTSGPGMCFMWPAPCKVRISC